LKGGVKLSVLKGFKTNAEAAFSLVGQKKSGCYLLASLDDRF